MNFQNLEYFLTVAEEMNVTKAAKRLHISEQALSRQIGKLEQELDVKLFERNPRFTLSPAGKRLKAAAEQIGNIHRQLHMELDDLNNNNTGELRIGVSYTRGQALLPRLLPPFHARHPGITITIQEGSSSELQDNLSKGRIDLLIGYVPRDLDAFEAAELSRERLFLVVPKQFMADLFGEKADQMRQRYAEGVDITAFKDLPFILLDRDDRVRRMADRLFSRYDITPRVLLETRNIQTAFALAMEGMGVTIYPELFLSSQSLLPSGQAARNAVDAFPLDGDLVQTIVVAYNPEKYLSNAARDFIEEAQSILNG